MARVFNQARHTVLTTGKDDYFGYPLTYFSNSVQQVISQNNARTSAQEAENFLKLWYNNIVDWFVPNMTSKNDQSIIEAVKRMRGCSKLQNIPFRECFLSENALHLLKPMDFFQTCEEIGLKIPQYNTLARSQLYQDLHQFKSLGLFDMDQYYLNSKEHKIDNTTDDFEKVLNSLENDHVEVNDEPVLLIKAVEGNTYKANLVCYQGTILVNQVSFSFIAY